MGGLQAPPTPPKFYHLLARKIVEATVQVQLHLKHENMERVRREELITSRSQQEGNKGVKTAKHRNTLIEQSTTLIEHPSLKFFKL